MYYTHKYKFKQGNHNSTVVSWKQGTDSTPLTLCSGRIACFQGFPTRSSRTLRRQTGRRLCRHNLKDCIIRQFTHTTRNIIHNKVNHIYNPALVFHIDYKQVSNHNYFQTIHNKYPHNTNITYHDDNIPSQHLHFCTTTVFGDDRFYQQPHRTTTHNPHQLQFWRRLPHHSIFSNLFFYFPTRFYSNATNIGQFHTTPPPPHR